MADIKVHNHNEVHFKIECERSVAMELYEYFSFFAKNYKFAPKYKAKVWDGKIRLFSLRKHTLYVGLRDDLIQFAKERSYEIEFEKSPADFEFSVYEAEEFIKMLNLPSKYEVRDYQLKAFVTSVRKRRLIELLSTGSGKSLVIYLLSRLYNTKTLIVVPTTSLVHQMATDFADYGYTKDCHRITSGVEKLTNHRITVSTWQSIYKMPKSWFSQFNLVIVDEVHFADAASLVSIMEKLENCKYRFGFTGTLNDSKSNELTLKGLFGEIRRFTTTAELIKNKYLAEFSVKSIVLKYKPEDCKTIKGKPYKDEIDFIISNKDRMKFLVNLALSLKGNTLLMFQFVEKHGEELYKEIQSKAEGRNVYFISGKVKTNVREEIRALVEKEENAIIIASSGTTAVGTNIVNISNMIFSSPSKSKIRTLQSIGRTLRRSEEKQSAVLYDIVDDLSVKSSENFCLRHFRERLKMYIEEEFPNKIYNVEL